MAYVTKVDCGLGGSPSATALCISHRLNRSTSQA